MEVCAKGMVMKFFTKAAILFCVIFMESGAVLHAQDAFPYPVIPDSVKNVEGRLSFLVRHYWDRFDFADTSLLKRNIAEQGLSNFLDILPRTDSSSAKDGIALFVSRFVCGSKGSEEAKLTEEYFVGKIEQYLYDFRSPMRDDSLYISFLREILSSPLTGVFERGHYLYIIENLMKNRVGEVAADFAFRDRNGIIRHLGDFAGKNLVLFFYDPDCNSCHGEIEKMVRSKSFMNSGAVVLAIYPGAESERWEKGNILGGVKDLLNSGIQRVEFVDGCSVGGEILTKDIYFIRELPSVYIIDKRGRVVLKECSVADVVSYF